MQKSEERPGGVSLVEVGDRIRRLRMARGISQGSLATEFGCAQSRISAIESGAREPGLDFLSWFAERVKTSIDYLVYGAERFQGGNIFRSAGDRFASQFFNSIKEPLKGYIEDFVNEELNGQKVYGLDEITVTSPEKTMIFQLRYLPRDQQHIFLERLNEFILEYKKNS